MKTVIYVVGAFFVVVGVVLLTLTIDSWLDKENVHGQTVVAPKATCISPSQPNDPSKPTSSSHISHHPIQKARTHPSPSGGQIQNPTGSNEIENPHAKSDGDDHGKGQGDVK